MKNSLKFILATLPLFALSCNEKGNTQNTTAEGTEIYDQRPHQNSGSASGNVDSITSPGSNAADIKAGNTGTDANMQNQSNTHGYDTQRGDNGTGSTGGTGSAAGTAGTGSGSVGSGSSGAASGSGR